MRMLILSDFIGRGFFACQTKDADQTDEEIGRVVRRVPFPRPRSSNNT